MKRNAGKTMSASVMPSAFEGWMWCIHEGAPGPRSLTKIINKIVSPRERVYRGDAPGRRRLGSL